MKNLIYLVLLSVTLISCSEEKNLKLIPLTSSSESAIELMRDFMKNSEERRNYLNEKLMDSIIKLDPDFSMALALNNFGNRDSRRANIIKATENFKLGVFAATAGIGVVYLVSFLMSMFGSGGLPVMDPTNASMISIGFSLFVVVIASLNLVMDFDFIEQGVEKGAPKYMEWYGAFGLLVTLVWLYLEILRMLAKMRNR